MIIRYGKPILVATDVNPPPKLVVKVAKMFNSRIFVPEKSINLEEKKILMDKFCRNNPGVKIRNSHERDALIAMLKAVDNLKTLFLKAEAKVREKGVSVNMSELKELLIMGFSIEDAIKCLTKKEEEVEEIKEVEVKSNVEEILRRENKALREKIIEKEKEIDRLRKELEQLRDEVNRLKLELERRREIFLEQIERDRRVRVKDAIIENLRKQIIREKQEKLALIGEIEKLKEIVNDWRSKEYIMASRIDKLTVEIVEEAIRKGIVKKADIIYVEDASGAGESAAIELTKTSPIAVIYGGKALSPQAFKVFKENEIVVLHESRVKIKKVGDYILIDQKSLNQAVKEYREEEKRECINGEQLENIIDDYRRKLARKVRRAIGGGMPLSEF